MKVKHIITTCGIIAGGLLAMRGASATVSYKTYSDVQFTFSQSLSLSLSSGDFVISDLMPRISSKSNAITATVSTNNVAGYTLAATVGDGSTYTTTDLTSSVSDSFAMIASNATSLSSGTWGYTLNGSAQTPTYGALDTVTPKVLNKTSNASGTAVSPYAGGSTTTMQIGAYAADDQLPGVYQNVVNFEVTPNVAMRTISLYAGTNVASVVLGASGTSANLSEGSQVTITATCDTGYTFNNWYMSADYGAISNISTSGLATTATYTVGANDVDLTAYCKASS